MTRILVAPAFLLIGVFGLVQFNRIANLHYHYDERGIIFSHSHPYDKSDDSGPVKSHGHGKCHLSIPTGIAELTMPADSPLFNLVPAKPAPLKAHTERGIENPEILCPAGRSPPSIVII